MVEVGFGSAGCACWLRRLVDLVAALDIDGKDDDGFISPLDMLNATGSADLYSGCNKITKHGQHVRLDLMIDHLLSKKAGKTPKCIIVRMSDEH